MKRRLLPLLVAALFSIALAQSNPLKDPNICGRPECKEGGKFLYKPGTKYNYKYAVNVSSLFVGTSRNESSLFIEGNVHLDFISHCDGILTLSDVALRKSFKLSTSENVVDTGTERVNVWSTEEEDETLHGHSREFGEELAEFSVRFAFHDGIITEVCPYEEEKNWVLNFKKGILSMLHNTMRRFDLDHEVDDEEDVRGRCKTKYQIQGPKATSLVVRKVKDMSSCEARSRLHSMIQSTPYNFRVNYKGKSLLKSESHCEFAIDHRVYCDVTCEETHLFEPFSNQAAGATTLLQQKLTLLDETVAVLDEQAEIERRTPLLYDHVPTPKATSGELKASRDLIKQLCRVSADDERIEFSDLFTKFIHIARLLSSSALTALHNHASTLCVTGKKHVMDALPYLGSEASIELMKTVYLDGALPESVAREWMMSIALTPLPTKAMILTAQEFLEGKQDANTVLAVSSITHTFCKQHADCRMESDAIDNIIQLLEDQAVQSYTSHLDDRKTQETLLVALKALANIGVASESFKTSLQEMIEDVQVDVAIRVAAVDAHRRLPCEETRLFFEEFFRDERQDAEVRIAAYLQVMRCPNYLVIRTIKHSLEYEEVNQVGSFIWSHLHNLLKSSIPSRVEIQGLLSDKDLTKKFSSDVRKFSHNYEGSVFFEEYNVGGNYESNVIFSPTSYIPRSAMLNVTVDLFGESINLLEVYGRLEGFEHYAESIFGPKGKYSAKNLQEHVPQMRWGRSASNADALVNAIEDLGYKMDNNFGSPKVGLGMKLFGNELKYATFNGDEEIRAALRNLDPVEHLKRILSGREINFNKAAMFLDTSYVVASGAGLPVTLNAVGTTSINLQLKGSLDAENFLKTKEMDVGASINPSVALDIVGTMSVDAYFATTGIKLKTSMHTTTAIDAHVKIRGLKLLSVKFGLPKTTNEIIGVSSELIVLKGSGEEEQQEGLRQCRVQEAACTWPAVDKTLGLKLCAEYHFANVTDMPNAPHFIMAGPAGFRVSLKKADPTAITYLLEYKWEEAPESSYMSLTLDTPDSSIPRIMGANLTIDKESQNLTLLLRSTEGTVLARGKYKNTENEKYVQLGLDINNQKNFDALLSLEKKEIRNGYMYEPKLYLGINEERVAELQGSVKLISKAGISQYDVDLKFKTKRLASKLFGYVSLSKTSVTSTLKLDYKFVHTREHELLLDVGLTRRYSPNMEVITGEAKVESTAYPNYNFNSTVTLQRAAGHLLLKGLLNASPHLHRNLTRDKEMLTVEAFLTYRSLKNGTRFKVSAAMGRESTELDVKALVSYEQMGYGTDVVALVRTGRDKDVIVSVYWYHPRQMLELYEGRLNVTIPTFKPMVLEGKLKEKNSADYTVELDCTWFSGHKFDVKGLYQDRSTDLAAIHHLKLLVRSPSFNEINADCYYHRNNTVFKIDIKADHDADQYGLNVLHIRTSPYEIMSSGRLLYKGKLYSISSLISLKEKREISLELHIDQMRDISVSLWANNKESYKEAGFDVKWDANRDPNQKLVVTVYYANAKPYNYDANFYISYPGRTIKGYFTVDLDGGSFGTTTGVTWSPDDSLSLQLAVELKNDEALTMLAIRSLVLTPFEDWRRTSLNGGFSHAGNMYRANGSMHWQHDQHVSIDLFGDYAATPANLSCEFTGALDSTVRDIPSLSASVKHSHNATKVDSEVRMMYQPKQKIAVTSSWQIDEDAHMKNLTGAVTLVSPFKGFNKGLLVSKIYVTSARDLRGVANLDMDHKEFSASVEGHFQKLSRSTLVFNVTTPIEKFKLMKGRFGFHELRRHLVAQIEYPSGRTGIEVRFDVASLARFDVLFNVATPLEFLQDMLVVGKLQPAALDFRVGWNSLLAGFAGAWHYANITDFEYAYKIYTPIDGFEENGIVAKLIFKEGLDFEVSVKLAQSQLGVIAHGKSNPRLLEELGIRTQAIYIAKKLNQNDDSPFIEDLLEPDDDSDEDDDDAADEEEEDPLNWSGYAEVHTLLYPCVTIDVDIDQKGSVYDLTAKLSLPDGEAILRDEFDFGDALNMKNHLSLSTPYAVFQQFTSSYEFRVMMGHQYLLALDANYLNGSRWIKAGTLAHYFNRKLQSGEGIYNATFRLHTPFDAVPQLEVRGALQKGDHAYATNFTLMTDTTDVAIQAGIEKSDELLSGTFDGHIDTAVFTLPESSVRFMKDFGPEENRIEFDYTMLRNKSNDVKLDAVWKLHSLKDMKVRLYLKTPFKGLEKTEADVEVRVTGSNALARTNIQMYPIAISANATLRDNDLDAMLDFDFDGKRHLMDFDGRLMKKTDGKHHIEGVINAKDKMLKVAGTLEMNDDGELPKTLEMTVQGGSGVPIYLKYAMQPRAGGFVVTNSMRQGEKFVEFTGNTNVRAKFDWDLHLQIETSHHIYKTFVVNAKAETSDSNRSLSIDAVTPFERLERIKSGAAFAMLSETLKTVNAFYDLGETSCHVTAEWSWLLLEDMSVKLIGNYRKPNYRRHAAINAFYSNANKAFRQLKVGAQVDLNNDWVMSSNVTMARPERGMYELAANLALPKPHDETHIVTGQYHAAQKVTDIEYKAKYRTLKSLRNYGSSGVVSYRNRTHLNGDVLIEWNEKHVRNYVDLHQLDNVTHLLYKLRTPKFQQDALIANVSYASWQAYHNVTGQLFYPGNQSIGVGHINFKQFGNMNGFINASTPFQGLNYTAAKFATQTTPLIYNRYLQIFWPGNNAFLDAQCTTTEVRGSAVERDTKGVVLVELPLTTRHVARVDYDYSKKPALSVGHAAVVYNKERILNGTYNCASESRGGFDKDTIHVELENKWVPIGADYVRSYEYGGREVDPTTDTKHLKVYHLHNASAFDVTGNMRVLKRETGKEITLMAIHSNRTVRLTTNYDVLDQQFKQYSSIEMSPTHWLAYEIDLRNNTVDDTFEAQQVQINLSYPRRNFTAAGSYNITDYVLTSGMSLDWIGSANASTSTSTHVDALDVEQEEAKAPTRKCVEGIFAWSKDITSPNRHEIQLELKHPSLDKNVTLLGEYDRNEKTLADVRLTVDYSPDPEQTLKMRALLENHSDRVNVNYTYGLWADHPATTLQLDVAGGVHYRRRRFYSHHFVDYKRSYLPTQVGEATTRIDIDLNEIEMKRKTLHELSYLWGRYAGSYPLYTANVTAIHEKDINASGEFYLNFVEKLLQLELNLTEDGSQSMHMHGYIPDARSAYFDVWRDYDEDRISDVAYFLKLNHSRLIVASLRWRPELKQNIKDGIRALSVGLYNHTMERSDYWRQYVRSEMAAALTDIWEDAKPRMQEFIDDIKDLRVIEEDLDELKVFLNDSYNANEFYIKDVVRFVVQAVDELSIRKHIESLPAIFNEIWDVMGESGEKIHKSVAWVIDRIKEYYRKTAEFINAFLQGDALEHLADGMQQLVEKYDQFIKDSHVAFIRYVEELWNQTYRMLMDNWHKTLAALEPKFITLVHYLETILWNAGTEILDFLYIRNSDIIDNPYVSKISNFTHDLDRFYHDITGNDTLGSVHKYSKIAWEFVKEKYFKLVPFGRELQEIANEIVGEVNELKKLPSVRALIEKYNELEAKLEWFYDYFHVENRLHRLVTLLHAKLTDMKQTALQAENRYREAKTKFFFEPADGIMHLEQKLPMSWHAFNETPKFQEIPEYKTFNDVQGFFSESKMTFANFYYDYKPYTDPMDWLPPFKAQALLVGSQYYVTFDGRVYDFHGGCTHLLASDFLDGNFSIAVSFAASTPRSHELLLVLNGTLVRIDMFANVVRLGSESQPAGLPLQAGEAFVYQEADIVTVESERGFTLQCNLKFDMCLFEVAGWYFGKTAGLWGTMNNEPFDDLSTPNRTRLSNTTIDVQRFADSWSLDTACSAVPAPLSKETSVPAPNDNVLELCTSFFDSKVSPFESCFDRVPVEPFDNMCRQAATEHEACTAAIAYMKMCSFSNTPLRIPDACVKCQLANGTVEEGTFITMSNETLPTSADIVFIVEAKECNKDLRQRRRMEEFVHELDKEITSLKYRSNKYAVVVFGGDGVYDEPRSIVEESIFTTHRLLPKYFNRIVPGNGSDDIFKAIAFATKLIFRPGVSKLFILLPCTDCKESKMTLDYTTIHQLLLENDVALHILMNDEFRAKKSGKIKGTFGVDRRYAYAKKDVEQLRGDKALRKSVQLPKSTLGVCASLALETNGSLFAGRKLDAEKSARKILGVFAKRVAQSAVANACKTCECTADNSGVSYMECMPCHYPTPLTIEYGDEDEMLAALQPDDDELFDLPESAE